MLVKRYHVKDMQEAMDTVVKELGSDAVILSSRKMRKKGFRNLFKKPLLEVMVAYDPAKIPMTKNLYGTYLPPKPEQDKTREDGEKDEKSNQVVVEHLQNLDSRIESIDHILNDFMSKFSFVKRDITYDYSEGVEALLVRLVDNQVREELAHSLAKQTDAILKRQNTTNAIEVMEHLILECLGAPEPIQHKKFTQKVVLMIGPTGVGKTTSLVKLAANFCVRQKKKVGIINTDTYRIAAQEQLKAYSDILSIPLGVVYQASEISAQIESMADREIIFIDTAGKRPGDEQHREDILRYMEIARPEDILLCVSASTSFSAMKEVIDTYSFIGDYKLLVTKLDETRYHGIILNLSWYAGRRLAYVTTGQNVPDDIENADTDALADQLLRQ